MTDGGASTTYPGNIRHQALLRAIAHYYAADPRILALSVFGSLARGNWDDLSDLDLDVVVRDGGELDVMAEVGALCAALASIGERAALRVPRGHESADVVFVSLNNFSIRYHPLATTSPNIVDSLIVLAGALDAATIVAAGLANQSDERKPLAPLLEGCLRDGLYVTTHLRRARFELALAQLTSMRDAVIELFQHAHAGKRAYHTWETMASADLQAALARALPCEGALSVKAALEGLFDLLETRLDEISADMLRLTDEQRTVVAGVRARLAASV